MKMKLRLGCGVLTLALLTACGGSSDVPEARPSAVVSGYAVDGAIIDGTVNVYAFADGIKGERLGGGVTDGEGFYSINIRAPSQPVLIEVTGGRYVEHASGVEVTLRDGQRLRSVALYESGQPLAVMVTPLTHLVSALTEFKIGDGVPVDGAVRQAALDVATVFAVDVMSILPLDITDARHASSALTDEHLYGFLLAALSSWTAWASEQNGVEPHTSYTSIGLSQILYDDVRADGVLDGVGVNQSGESMALAFGQVSLDQEVYRAALAQQMLAMAYSEVNKTGLTTDILLASAQNLAASNHAVFGGLEPDPLTGEPPTIINVEPEGLYHNGVFDYAVVIAGALGAETVEFDIDGIVIGEAVDPRQPTFPIDTRTYPDGQYQIGVRAIDILGGESYAQFTINFDNTEPFVNVTSAPLTNQATYALSGTYGDNGAGVRSLLVQGQAVELNEAGTWTTEIALVSGHNSIAIVLVDNAGNERHAESVVALDVANPLIDTAVGHGAARFSNGDGTFVEAPLADQNDGMPLYLETDALDLNGVPITPSDLDANGIVYFVFSATDPVVDDVASAAEDITVRMQYLRNGEVWADWRELSPVDGQYLVPLASETLHIDWHRATPLDQHQIAVQVEDGAANLASTTFSFTADFYVPEFTVTDVEDLNQGLFPGTAFADRGNLHGMTFSSTAYTFTNDTGKSYYISLEDDSTHSAINIVERKVRENLVRLKTTTVWRVGLVDNATQACPTVTAFQEVSDIANYTAGGWEKREVSAPTYGDPEMASEDAPVAEPSVTDWSSVPDFDNDYATGLLDFPDVFQTTYRYDYVLAQGDQPTGAEQLQPAFVSGWEFFFHETPEDIQTCPDVRAFEQREEFAYESESGYPRNVLSTFDESADFATTNFIVVDNDAGTLVIPISGWYRVPAGHSVTITKFVTTPLLTVYNDTSVAGSDDAFTSYTPLNYDRTISWEVGRSLTLTLVHDAGEDNLFAMPTRDIAGGQGEVTYQISR